jgi:gamma-glutamyltranspeptidase/glutathione hydrolase
VRSSVLVVVFLLCLCPAVCAWAGEVCGRGGVVVTASPPATAVGVEILKRGGNAVDAAVAVGFALAVTYPQAGNIGGGGFLLARLGSGETAFIDFREKAPRAASRDMYLDSLGNVIEGKSILGAMAAGVPGTVRGLHEAYRLYGSLPWRDLVAPAVHLARDGFSVSSRLAASLDSLQRYRERFPALAQFMRSDGTPLKPGDTLRQENLASTLERIALGGPGAFYQGAIADAIVSEMHSSGGIISTEDLAQYRACRREPVRGFYRGYEIISAPPPSSGGTILLEILNISEGFDLSRMGFMSDRAIHYLVEAERRAYVDRARYLGDPDFVENPISKLISKDYAAALRKSIGPRATPSTDFSAHPSPGREKEETTHYSIIDTEGNAVAVTYTLNESYGSKIVVRGAGFLLNNEMDDFSIKPGHPNLYGLVGAEANAIEPGKRMLSSMAPTIVLKGGKIFLVLGTPGGSTIITTIAQIIIDMIDFGMGLEEAVAAPRFHHQWLPDCITVEDEAFGGHLRRSLIENGHRVEDRCDPIGDAQVIEAGDSSACGMSDPRGDGSAGGVEPMDSSPR